jgi:hypothetical protein
VRWAARTSRAFCSWASGGTGPPPEPLRQPAGPYCAFVLVCSLSLSLSLSVCVRYHRSGKSSIQKVVFHKMSPNETLFLESTSKVIKNGRCRLLPLPSLPGSHAPPPQPSLPRLPRFPLSQPSPPLRQLRQCRATAAAADLTVAAVSAPPSVSLCVLVRACVCTSITSLCACPCACARRSVCACVRVCRYKQ